MIICVKCRKEMRCDKNGIGASFGGGHVYVGDRFKCPVCGIETISTNSQPIYDPELITKSEYLNMEPK